MRGLDAKVLDVACAKVFCAAVVRVAVRRELAAHVDLRAGERRRRHGHDGCSSKGEAYAKLVKFFHLFLLFVKGKWFVFLVVW